MKGKGLAATEGTLRLIASSTDARRLFDPAQRPLQPPQRLYQLPFRVAQDVAHPAGAAHAAPARQRLGSLYNWPVFTRSPLAAFARSPRVKD